MADKKKVQKKQGLNYASAKERIVNHDSGYSPTAVKLPKEFDRLTFDKKGTYRIDIIPYRVGKGNPFADEGAVWCERTYYTHRNIGPENKSYCCLAKTFKKKCPICEEIARLNRTGGDADLIKALKPSERQLWNVKLLQSPDRDADLEGIKVLDQSNFLFGQLVDNKVAAADEEDHYENYFHLEGGHTLKITVDQDSFAGKSFYKATNIEMKARKEDYDESIIEEACCLDDCLVELSYDKLKSIFLQENEGDSDDDSSDDEDTPVKKTTAKAKGKGKPPVDDDDDEDDEPEDPSDLDTEDDDDDEPAPPKKSGKRKPDPDEDDEDSDDSSDLETDEDDLDENDDDDDEDSEDDTKPPVKKKPGRPAGSKNKK